MPCPPPTPPSAASSVDSAGKPGRTKLSVALVPWIPDAAGDDFASLRRMLEEGFESQHAAIDLELRLIKSDDSYHNPTRLAGWLASGRYDLVEIDSVLLGDLIDADVLEPWPSVPERDYLAAARSGSTEIDRSGKPVWWGVPHLTCGFFLVTRSEKLHAASNIVGLVKAARESGKPLLGSFTSSWDLPALYLDARVDNGLDATNLPALSNAVNPPLHADSAAALEQLAELCRRGDKNPCVDGTYDEAREDPAEELVKGSAIGYWGYSERLHRTVTLMKAEGAPVEGLRVSTIPLGTSATPLLFTDAFVRRKGCSGDAVCNAAAAAWAEFITRDDVVRDLLISKDAGPNAVPRYLLPATSSAFKAEPIAKDAIYAELRPLAQSGRSFPSHASMYERRRVLAHLLETHLAAR
jgi:thiamine pyridinylase